MKHIHKQEFKKIRALLKEGLTISKVAEVTGRAQSTLYYLRRFDSFKAFRQNLKAYNLERKVVNPQLTTETTIDPILKLEQMVESFKNTVEEVIVSEVQKRSGELEKQIEAKHQARLQELETIANAAKAANWTDGLKKRLASIA